VERADNIRERVNPIGKVVGIGKRKVIIKRGRTMRTEQEIKRLEELSDQVRMGIPIDFSEAIEVIEYQTELAEIRANSVSLVRRWWDTIRGVR